MSETVRRSWFRMNESLVGLLEAVLTLAASDAAGLYHPIRSAVNPGGYSEDIFLDLTEEEQDEFSCNICYQVLKDTMRCMNQHKFCHSCLYVWSTTGLYANRIRCPVCRCQGFYVRDDDIDERIHKKRVQCSQETCRWNGPLSLLSSHRHTVFGGTSRMTGRAQLRKENNDEDEEENETAEERGAGTELPYVIRPPPQSMQSRFSSLGLETRSTMTRDRAAVMSENRSDPILHTTVTSLDSSTTTFPISITLRPEGTVPPRDLLRNNTRPEGTVPPRDLLRNNTRPEGTVPPRDLLRNNTTDTSSSVREILPTVSRPTMRQRVHPIQRSITNRITITHTDGNNNLSSFPVNETNTASRGTVLHPSHPSSPDGAILTPQQPRQRSSPRPPDTPSRRSLGLSALQPNLRPFSGTQSRSSSTGHVVRAPPTFNASQAQGHSALDAFHSRLQESRDRLESFMSSYSSEMGRSRQEVAQVQEAVQQEQRDHLSDVQNLEHRLGQVAGELRTLLNHRRSRPSGSDE